MQMIVFHGRVVLRPYKPNPTSRTELRTAAVLRLRVANGWFLMIAVEQTRSETRAHGIRPRSDFVNLARKNTLHPVTVTD